MKSKNYRHSKLKKQLRKKKEYGIKVVEWELTPETREVIESFGYYVEPYIYQINTRTFRNIRLIESTLLKDLHYMNKRGKYIERRTLTNKEKRLLDKFGIKYKPVKYKIHLSN